jgi:ATP-dependent exoDNAse (exonuclease V) beta subunit
MAKREYNNDYPSVTTVLGVLRKIALENWFKFTPLKQIQEESERGKQIGTEIHEAIHNYIETGKTKIETEYAEEVMLALKSFILFRQEHPEITLRNAEIALTSERYRYNGTLDCEGQREGSLLILDWKVTRAKKEDTPPIYDEYKYQVAAYRYLYEEVKKTEIRKAIIIVLAKDKIAYTFYELNEEELAGCFEEVFLPALRIYNYQHKKEV